MDFNFVGPPEQSSSMSFAEMISGGSKALQQIINAGNDVKKALNGTSVSQGSSSDLSAKPSVPIWVWLIGAVVLYKVTKG
jgi:hypothetical protein